MDAARVPSTAGVTAADELRRENEELREQIRRLSAQTTVARGAITEAVHEKEATARMAHQVSVEERATRAAVETQGNTIGFAVVLQIVNFFMLLVLALGLFAWLPREIETRVEASSTQVIAPQPGGGVIIPGR